MISRWGLGTVLTLGAFMLPATAATQSPADAGGLERQVRELVDPEVAGDRFSGVVLVATGGLTQALVAGGHADVQRGIPVTLDTRFNIASGDKLFTKVAILQLVQEGRVALADTVGKFLPSYASETVRRAVTVEQLLRHRSGLGSYWGEAFQRDRARMGTLEDLVPLFEREAPAFQPGSGMLYSNSGYVVLGRIVEVVTGLSYHEYVRTHVFEPAGMSRTSYLTIQEWPTDKAVGYTTQDSVGAPLSQATGGRVPARTTNQWSLAFRGSSAGGGYSTARDLLALDGALASGDLVDAALLARFTLSGPDGSRVLANGGGPGANLEFVRSGDHTIIVLSNYDPPAATRMRQQVTALVRAWEARRPGTRRQYNRCVGCRPPSSGPRFTARSG